jgi:hypothetical protein
MLTVDVVVIIATKVDNLWVGAAIVGHGGGSS